MSENGKDRCREALQWVVLSMLVVAGHWAGSAAFEFLLAAVDWEWHRAMAWVCVPLAALPVVFIALFYIRLTTRLGMAPRLKPRHFFAIGLAVATLLAAYGAALSGERTLTALENGWPVRRSHFWGGVLYWLSFITTSSLLFAHKDDLGAVMQFPKQRPSQRRKHLILFLSELGPQTDRDGVLRYDDEGIPRWFTPTKNRDIDTDLQTLLGLRRQNQDQRWSWEMPFRAIRHHIGTLEQVTVVCSPQSIERAHGFFRLSRGYFPSIQFHLWARVRTTQCLNRLLCADEVDRGPETNRVPREPDVAEDVEVGPSLQKQFARCEGIDFEDLNTLSSSMFQLLDVLTEQNNVSDRDIMIDFTGGQKTTSLVAACLTFNRPLNAQYVRTGGRFERPGEDIISFDLTVDPLATGPG